MRLGIWTPLPHTIRPEPGMERAIARLKSNATGKKDGTFEFACDVVRRADELGFDTTLIASAPLSPEPRARLQFRRPGRSLRSPCVPPLRRSMPQAARPRAKR